MTKLTNATFVALVFILAACGSKPTEEASTDATENINAKSETNAICMWNKLSLRETPKGDGAYITAGNMGEVMTYMDSTVTDEASSKKRKYALVKLSDGTEGWMRHDLIVIDAAVGVILKNAAICERADLITKTNKSFEAMDIVAIMESNNGWVKVKGIIKGGNWYSEGWIQESSLSYRTPDITDAILVTKAMAIENEDERVVELKRIYELDYGGEYSEFKSTIKSVIGTISTLNQEVYDAYTCFFTNEPVDYNFSSEGEQVSILGNQYGKFYYSLFGVNWQLYTCFSKARDEHPPLEMVMEDMSGVPVYTLTGDEAIFKHVNPKFVTWTSKNLIPSVEDDFLGTNLQHVYNVIFREEFRKFETAYWELESKYPNLTQDYKQNVVVEGKDALEYMRTYVTHDGERDWNLEWYLAFWARRDLDGSKNELRKALDILLNDYDLQALQIRMG